MTWNCRCELCRRAFRQSLEPRYWTDFLRHRENSVIRADMNDGEPVYLTELDGEIVAVTETMDEPKTLCEIETEEAVIIDFLEGCNVEPVEEDGTYLEPISEPPQPILRS